MPEGAPAIKLDNVARAGTRIERCAPNMAARDAAWSKFGQDPDWRTLSADPQYRDNVSAISDIILRPTSYSQI